MANDVMSKAQRVTWSHSPSQPIRSGEVTRVPKVVPFLGRLQFVHIQPHGPTKRQVLRETQCPFRSDVFCFLCLLPCLYARRQRYSYSLTTYV